MRFDAVSELAVSTGDPRRIIATWCEWTARGPVGRASLAVLFARSYDPLGGLFPRVAKKLTQSP
jgi:hypothetical protein